MTLDPTRFAQRIQELKNALQGSDPYRLAAYTGADYQPGVENQGVLRLHLWERERLISYPDLSIRNALTGEEASPMDQAMLMYYFNTADGAPQEGRWISFAELPGGRFYNRAYQGYTGTELVRHFNARQEAFIQAARSLGGVHQSLGDASFAFQALPRVVLLVIYWQGDEEFPSSFQVLFDASASHYLPTDAYAILGSTLTGRLIKLTSK